MEKFRFYSLWFAGVCIIVFILQLIFKEFIELFVLNNRAIYNFEIWRFLTAIFLHSSGIHLLYNMFALLIFGYSLEKLIEGKMFLVVFFGSGIIANIIAVNFYASSLGASGAIYGILGCLAIIRPMMMVWAFGLILPMFIAAIVWIIGDVIGIFYPSGVGNIAHLSGIGVGFIIGLVIRIRGKMGFRISRKERRINIPEDYIRKWEDGWGR